MRYTYSFSNTKKMLLAAVQILLMLMTGCGGSTDETGTGSEADNSTKTENHSETGEKKETDDAQKKPPVIGPSVEDASTEAAGGEKIVLRFAGDFTLAEEGGEGVCMPIMETLDDRFGGDITQVFSSDLLEMMRSADIFMLNNEFTFTDQGTPREGKTWTFRADPDRVTAYHDMGVDLVGIANNHAYDWGKVSLLDTIATLDAAGIKHVGAGADLEEASAAVCYELGGRTFSFVAMTFVESVNSDNFGQTKPAEADSPGVLHAGADPEAALAAVEQAKANSDYCVAFVHWGVELSEELDSNQKKYAKKLIDAGADAVIGSHPHILQGFEFYKGKPILYSLGNYWFNSKLRENCLVELTVDTGTMEVQTKYLPCLQRDSRTVLVTKEESKTNRIKEMEEISYGVKIDENGIVTAQ